MVQISSCNCLKLTLGSDKVKVGCSGIGIRYLQSFWYFTIADIFVQYSYPVVLHPKLKFYYHGVIMQQWSSPLNRSQSNQTRSSRGTGEVTALKFSAKSYLPSAGNSSRTWYRTTGMSWRTNWSVYLNEWMKSFIILSRYNFCKW